MKDNVWPNPPTSADLDFFYFPNNSNKKSNHEFSPFEFPGNRWHPDFMVTSLLGTRTSWCIMGLQRDVGGDLSSGEGPQGPEGLIPPF